MLAFAVDVQVGIPRFWTGVGDRRHGHRQRVAVRAAARGDAAAVVDHAARRHRRHVLAFVVGMPSMVRTRFATPTIGREWMIGELGEVVVAVDPDGVVKVGDGTWRARTNRATPVAVGAPVRVVAIDGVTLEVEPLEGAARDYRERR